MREETTTLIEVFVEKNCHACSEVLSAVAKVSGKRNVRVAVFLREQDVLYFRERQVFICPATFINRKLVFYGSFSPEALAVCLGKIQ